MKSKLGSSPEDNARQIPVPGFLSERDGRLFVKYIEGTDVTDEYRQILEETGIKASSKLPYFLYIYDARKSLGRAIRKVPKDGDSIRISGMEGADYRNEWEEWVREKSKN
ncbi:hypothetical protein JW758_05515 [Candidatus Peregrinibacteria bacterium]|nr:hypothetical protein [Candidatus Peregrinibacteria bacterium]